MDLKRSVNRALVRATGYELQKPDQRRALPPRRMRLQPGDRLLERPAFILSTVRSGSTLLRVLLDSHSQIHSPHEMHLKHIHARIKPGHPEKALLEVGMDKTRLRHLLWDRVLHRELEESGKVLLVNKTPNDVFIADQILACWPDARFIFLLRHPAAIARSRQRARPDDSPERNLKAVLRYGNAVQDARTRFPGLTVRYEELTAEPVRVTKEVCAFLGVEWEERMLDYGEAARRYSPGLGDWSENIKSGRIQPAAPTPGPGDTPPELHALAREWGYFEASVGAGAAG